MSSERFSRQSFLGPDSKERIARCTVGVPGLGGGGSHVIQQLAHIGFQRFVIYDGDVVEESNLNRLVGATSIDVPAGTPKLHIAKRMIFGLQHNASVRGFAGRWQDNPEPLRECQIVIGCVDSYQGRHELEVACRRYLMHYIDIGMDVHGEEPPVIGGQVILSSPGSLCMRCMGFLTDTKLAEEAARYGKAGARPQVVWPNGVLASTAIGLAVDIVSGWTRRALPYAYLVYDGNKGTVKESATLRNLIIPACPHFPDVEVGDPVPVEL
jgi:molybdopterin-synthase adenylyltransferase